jgi:predicted transcriptional regulator of viral defense system
MEIDLQEIDDLTPHFKAKLENELSVQERKVVSAICRDVEDGEITAKRVSLCSRIVQSNHVHSILSRLVKKGFLEKICRSTYRIKDEKLVAYLIARGRGRRTA